MKLRSKILVGLGSLFLLLFFSFYVVSQRLKEGFDKIERAGVLTDTNRVRDALNGSVAGLLSKQADWAQWDDTYAFIEDRNENYIRSNMTDEGLALATRLGLIVLVNRRGEIVFQKMVDLKTAKEIPIPEEFKKLVEPGSPLLVLPKVESTVGGLIATSSGTPFMVVSHPIVTSDLKGPIRGTIVWGNYLDESLLQKISKVTHLPFELTPLDPPEETKPEKAAEGEITVTENSEDSISGNMFLNDLYGSPRFLLRVTLPRTTHHQGLATIRVVMIFQILSAVLVGLLLLLFLRRVVLMRLERIGKAFAEVTGAAGYQARIPPMGKDEIGELAASFNAMTARLQESDEKLREQHDQLLQVQKMGAIGRLAGGIAHDFNNLLGIINGYCEMSLLGLKDDDPLRGNLQEIKEAGDRAATLTHQLLAFSRRQVLQPKVLNLNDVIGHTERMLRRLIGENIGLATFSDPGLGQVKADPGQMEQVIVNLALNARDAMPHGGKLTIETRNVALGRESSDWVPDIQSGRYVMVAVSDTGEGMNAETIAHIFEPFFTTKEKGKGTGLGLSTVHGVVKQSGGHVSVYSEPGHGTTFKVYLPRVDEAAEPLASPEISLSPSGGDETVLVAEDEERLRNLTCRVLREKGYTVLEASSGDEALRVSDTHEGPIALLLTDVIMPGMSGRETADKLILKRPETKVLYMSGYTDDAIVHHGVLEKGVHFLPKPFTPKSLARKVREVLGSSPK